MLHLGKHVVREKKLTLSYIVSIFIINAMWEKGNNEKEDDDEQL